MIRVLVQRLLISRNGAIRMVEHQIGRADVVPNVGISVGLELGLELFECIVEARAPEHDVS